jgi:hypothetical protein
MGAYGLARCILSAHCEVLMDDMMQSNSRNWTHARMEKGAEAPFSMIALRAFWNRSKNGGLGKHVLDTLKESLVAARGARAEIATFLEALQG